MEETISYSDNMSILDQQKRKQPQSNIKINYWNQNQSQTAEISKSVDVLPLYNQSEMDKKIADLKTEIEEQCAD